MIGCDTKALSITLVKSNGPVFGSRLAYFLKKKILKSQNRSQSTSVCSWNIYHHSLSSSTVANQFRAKPEPDYEEASGGRREEEKSAEITCT
ncbi:unnamed protein product [Allacma fusca]|uniref:Uncharacterized protein n=1 Tax=Allacma fusca TaxID=39272 RepID=A0A8J2LB57_9HEXA|nr:unnamed protein product [Allacma fusca]